MPPCFAFSLCAAGSGPTAVNAGRSSQSGGRGAGAGTGRGRGRINLSSKFVLEHGPHTLTSLGMRRQQYWESRTTGRAESWANLRLVCESLLENNVELAETVLDASGFNVIGQDLAPVVYDPSGASYEIPMWLYRNPQNLVSEEEARAGAANKKKHDGPVVSVPVLLRLSGGPNTLEQDVKLTVMSDQTAASVKKALHEYLLSGKADQQKDATTPKPNVWSTIGGLPPARMRLLFRGRILAEDTFMQEAGVTEGSVLQVFIKPE
jgi:Ubiquitin-binding domain/Ubiquitin family